MEKRGRRYSIGSLGTAALDCDELRPCSNCVRHQTPCSPTTPGILPSTSQTSPQHFVALSASVERRSGSPQSPRSSLPEWMQSLRLWQHYCANTCYTLTRTGRTEELWKNVVPVTASQWDSIELTTTPSDVAQSFFLLQGIKGILDFKALETWPAEKNELASLLQHATYPPQEHDGAFQLRLSEITCLLDVLPQSFDPISPRSVCLLALDSLKTIHHACKHTTSDTGFVWTWPFTFPALFIETISEKRHVPLIILAHFAALYQPHKHATWVKSALDPGWQSWIYWPKLSLGNEIDVDDMDE
ncbi:hypothetical protein BKA67DRAFT_595941 [Truncatella angustata]|uniref:Uncharacterized protein n=1 Tax=Truncatella angustata TaxID=152316 RepID=A0A9P8RKJ0_9PEZI|nr:uncharacterized protein BKA67DRAFT_595941 [Truncatella angustata]KAH6645010.1 hypothetical protein BKA67DRAFT_595941 [Truncatella angustata]